MCDPIQLGETGNMFLIIPEVSYYFSTCLKIIRNISDFYKFSDYKHKVNNY